MPNGDPWTEVQWTEIKGAFAEVSGLLEAFAGKYGLTIDRYDHYFPTWDLRFRRRIGGAASIEIAWDRDRDEFAIGGLWWLDSETDRTRSLKTQEPRLALKRPVAMEQLADTLEAVLSTIDSWRLGEWDRVVGPYREWPDMGRKFDEWHHGNHVIR